MKLQITKTPESGVKVSVKTNTADKPMTMTLTAQQVEMLTVLLTAAAKANVFQFDLEM